MKATFPKEIAKLIWRNIFHFTKLLSSRALSSLDEYFVKLTYILSVDFTDFLLKFRFHEFFVLSKILICQKKGKKSIILYGWFHVKTNILLVLPACSPNIIVLTKKFWIDATWFHEIFQFAGSLFLLICCVCFREISLCTIFVIFEVHSKKLFVAL